MCFNSSDIAKIKSSLFEPHTEKQTPGKTKSHLELYAYCAGAWTLSQDTGLEQLAEMENPQRTS